MPVEGAGADAERLADFAAWRLTLRGYGATAADARADLAALLVAEVRRAPHRG